MWLRPILEIRRQNKRTNSEKLQKDIHSYQSRYGDGQAWGYLAYLLRFSSKMFRERGAEKV